MCGGGLIDRQMKRGLGLGKGSLILDMSSWGLDRQAMMRGANGGVVKSQFQKDGLRVHRRRADDSCKAEAEEGVNRGLRRR